MLAIWQVVLGLTFTTVMSLAGAAFPFFTKKKLGPKFHAVFLGIAAGVMLAATIFSLIVPSMSEEYDTGSIPKVVPLVVGLIVGAGLLFALDRLVPHKHDQDTSEGIKKEGMKTSTKLWLADAIHNVPEGLAIGLTFGVLMVQAGNSLAFIPGILSMAIGMGIQNLPETASVSLALKEETGSKGKAFLLAVLSSSVELVFSILGVLLSTVIAPLMPWFLAFAAGAMLYVVIDELIPTFNKTGFASWGTVGLFAGFILMTALDGLTF